MSGLTGEDRFDSKLFPDPNSGCWLWEGSLSGYRYGTFWFQGRAIKAHRFSYERLVAKIPDGLVLDHKCRNGFCVNPAHLEPVTQRENIMRGCAPASIQARQDSCIHGHRLAGPNLYIKPNGARQCVACRRVTDRKRRGRHGNA